MPRVPSAAQVPTAYSPLMGQASRFRLGEPVLRFHASDSEASSPSVVSSGFAQVLGDDFRFFPSEDEATPAASSDSLSSRPSRPGLRYRHPQPWVPIDIRPRYMYSAGLSDITASASAEARLPMIFQSLEGILFGSQACAWTLLCLNHHEWFQVGLSNKACHDYVREQASASAMRLPSDRPSSPTGPASTTHDQRAADSELAFGHLFLLNPYPHVASHLAQFATCLGFSRCVKCCGS